LINPDKPIPAGTAQRLNDVQPEIEAINPEGDETDIVLRSRGAAKLRGRFLTCLILPVLMTMGFMGRQHLAAARLPLLDSVVNVPIGGNTWRMSDDTTGGEVTNEGIVNWTSKDTKFETYIRFAKSCKVKLWINLQVPEGESRIAVSALKITRKILVSGNQAKDYYVGDWEIPDTGYMTFQIKGLNKTGTCFAKVRSIKLLDSAIEEETTFVKDNEGDFFYWGRRGPSVHLSYETPDKVNAEWFYNEVIVPPDNDVVGSYFMADGFAEGYFGMQVNSPTERRILFSVWSPYKTDDLAKIPDDQKITVLKKGGNVHIGEFGNEGSGGQSYMLYNWQAGNTYRFLLHAKPSANNCTIYTAYFFEPEINKWKLVASFSRPQTSTYLKHLHSFLENFEPDAGATTREVFFGNQWIADNKGHWIELNRARFTVDNTGAKRYRMDFAGGSAEGEFYLRNCGFFNKYTLPNSIFEHPFEGSVPDVKLDKLP
jgi:hypothetical protein